MMKKIILPLFIFSLSFLSLSAQNTVSGQIECVGGAPMSSVTVELISNTGEVESVLTDGNGNYIFNDVATGGDYTIHVEKDGNPFSGVTTYDLVLIMQGILSPPFDTSFHQLAADVNLSGTVTMFDVLILRQLILYIITDLPQGVLRFATEDYSINPPAGYITDVPVLNLQEDLEVNFVGVKVGDLSSGECN